MRRFLRIEDVETIKPFNCGDEVLNGFLLDDARFFYEKNGFRLLQNEMPEGADTVLMYFDLKSFTDK